MTLLGYGTWTEFGQGRILASADVGQFAGDFIGSADHTHATHASAGAHTHNAHTQGRKGGTTNPQDIFNAPTTHSSDGAHTHDAHSPAQHLPLSVVVYVWLRTA